MLRTMISLTILLAVASACQVGGFTELPGVCGKLEQPCCTLDNGKGACEKGFTCDNDLCRKCDPGCEEGRCGPNDCGVMCDCAPGTECDEKWGVCKPLCGNGKCDDTETEASCPEDCAGCDPVENCKGKECGPNGCGGSCGECKATEHCTEAGTCEPNCIPQCDGKECGPDGCGGICGTCSSGTCDEKGKCPIVCVPDCTNKECGTDGCGGICGVCATGDCDQNGKCEACGSDGIACCNGNVCSAGKCFYGTCCTPNCNGKQCGDDGCGGSCDSVCEEGQVCNAGNCCTPNCTGKQCGSDGCGGSCGGCLFYGEQCLEGACYYDGPVCSYYAYNTHIYAVCNEFTNWTLANKSCTDYGTLVVLDDALELAAVNTFVGSIGYLIGLFEKEAEKWYWKNSLINLIWTGNKDSSNKTIFPGLDWCTGEPNDSSTEDCAEKKSEGCVNDIQCNKYEDKTYVCEYICVPNCDQRECGSDGCGGTCGEGCATDQVCYAGECCTPSCVGKVCGSDGCGGICGPITVVGCCATDGQGKETLKFCDYGQIKTSVCDEDNLGCGWDSSNEYFNCGFPVAPPQGTLVVCPN